MLRPHSPLFNIADGGHSAGPAAKLTPAQVAATMPRDFSANTTTEPADSMIEAGDATHDGPGAQPAQQQQFTPQQPAQPQQQQQPEQFQQEQPLPPALQPQQQQPAQQQPQQPQIVTDPAIAMTMSMRAAFPDESPSQIADRVAKALAPAAQQQQQEQSDPDQERMVEIDTQLAALQKQAAEEGSSDFDEQIRSLDREKLKLETKLSVREEMAAEARLNQFAADAQKWDNMATAAYPDSDVPGTNLQKAVDARVQAILANDPDYFIRSPDAGYSLVATEAAKLGIAPKVTQQGAVPAPGTPQPISGMVALPGSVQTSHRPSQQPQPAPGHGQAYTLAAAEAQGFAGELALGRQIARGGFSGDGVQFVS